MKQNIYLYLLCFLLSLSLNAQNFVRIDKNNFQQQISLSSNEVLEIRLPANPSTGYMWQIAQIDNNVFKQAGNWEFITDNVSAPVGSTGTQIIRFIGVAAGIADLELKNTRAWEMNSVPTDLYKVQIKSSGQYKGTYNGEPLVSNTLESVSSQNTQKVDGTLPTSFSWLAQGQCTPAKNQGSCGSCWSFAACGSFEAVIKMFDNVTRNLSEQWLVNCDQQATGCNGGWCPDYMFKNYGAVYETDEAYTQQNGTCKSVYTYHEKPVNYKEIATTPTVAQIKQAIYDYGPVWACVCVGNNFNNYSSGVLKSSDGSTVNHAIVLVGWDDATNSWILRNSWGTSWGENAGYMRIGYGVSNVGYRATYLDYKGIFPHNAAPVAGFSVSAGNTCTGTVQFTDNTTGVPTSWNWNFGDGQSSTQQNPAHNYTTSGTYNVTLVAQNSLGSNTLTKNSAVVVNILNAPTTAGGSHVGPGVVNLSANASGGTLNWYTQATGGNIVNTGTTYSPNLNSTTTFYVANEITKPSQQVGLVDNSAGGSYYTANTDRRLLFDVHSPVILKSVAIYANTAGNRTIEVVNSLGTNIASTTYTASVGMNTVPLNFNLPAGTGYAMKIATGSTVDLFRNNKGVSYPYTINGLVSITNSDAATSPENYYYYFYNWKVEEQGCSSSRTPVVGTISGTNGIADMDLNAYIKVYPNPSIGQFTIEGLEKENTIEVFDMLGKQVFQDLTKNANFVVDITGKDKGVYLYKITNMSNKYVKKGKILVIE